MGPRKGATPFSRPLIQPLLQVAHTAFTVCPNNGIRKRCMERSARIISPVPTVAANCGNNGAIHNGITCSAVVGEAPQNTQGIASYFCVSALYVSRFSSAPFTALAKRGPSAFSRSSKRNTCSAR